jgi:hypothetical protein
LLHDLTNAKSIRILAAHPAENGHPDNLHIEGD